MTARLSLLGAALAIAAVAAVSAAAGLGPSTFTDRRGDVQGGAGPDIAAVTISHTATAVRFSIRFTTAPALRGGIEERWMEMLLVGIDAPPLGPSPKATGWFGANYWLGLHTGQTTAVLVEKASRRSIRLPATTRGATIVISVPRARIGNPRWFGFIVAAGREGENEAEGGSDYAPAKGVFRYTLGG